MIRYFLALALAAALVGCGNDGYGGNAPGKDANAGKEYSKEDARSAQPVRGGSEKAE